MSARRPTIAALCAIVTTTVIPIAAEPSRAAARAYPVQYVTDADSLVDLSADGRWAVIQRSSNPPQVLRADLVTGAVTPLPSGPLGFGLGGISDDGATYWWASSATDDLLRRTTVGGTTVTLPNPFTSPVEGELWVFTGVSQVDGATPILSASNGAVGNALFRYDPGSGVVERIRRPFTPIPIPEHDSSIAPAGLSDDRAWATFWSADPNVVPGLVGSTPRLFRKHLSSGAIHLVGAYPDNQTTIAIWVGNGGLVLIAPPDGGGNRQLFAWFRPGTQPAPISVRPDGSSSGPLTPFSLINTVRISDDSTKVVFTSTANDLDVPLGGSGSRLYVATLPAPYPNADAVVQPGETYCLAAVGADPGDFVGVNVTPLLAVAPGFGVLHSSDDAPGGTSNVNFGPGTVDPNVAFAKVGADGRICFTNSVLGPVHVLLDQLIVADAAVFRSPTPSGSVRLADTRIGLGGPIVAPSETRCVAAAGAAPGEFVGVNVLPVEATAAGFGTLHPSGSGPGASSTANFGPGTFDPNFAFTKVGPDGQICFTNSVHGPVHVLLDELIVGVSTALAAPTPGPNSDRPVDTRLGLGSGTLAPGASVCFTIPGGSPGDFGGVNLLPLQATGPGFGTLRSSDDAPGSTSNANFGVGTFDPNFAIAEFGADGRMCFTNSQNSTTDVIVDSQVIADSSAFAQPTPTGSVRLVDTRIGRV